MKQMALASVRPRGAITGRSRGHQQGSRLCDVRSKKVAAKVWRPVSQGGRWRRRYGAYMETIAANSGRFVADPGSYLGHGQAQRAC